MLGRSSDLPFARDPLARFLPWLIAFMTYLAVLALAAVQVLGATVDHWHTDLSGTLTVQIPASDNAVTDDGTVRSVMEILHATQGVAHAEALSQDRVVALLEPWLGSKEVAGELPLPRLIDVTVLRDGLFDVEKLRGQLADAAPGAVVDDHGVWLIHLVRLVRTTEIITIIVLAIIGLITAGTVVFATRTGLAIHHDAVELLHLIGARDSYVAGQFAVRALALGLKGGMIGLVFGAATLFALDRLAARLQGGPLSDLALAPEHWVILALVPVAVAIIAMVTARVTVMRSLMSML